MWTLMTASNQALFTLFTPDDVYFVRHAFRFSITYIKLPNLFELYTQASRFTKIKIHNKKAYFSLVNLWLKFLVY